MTNILVECPQKIASVRVGVLEPLRPMETAGLCRVRYRDTKELVREDIAWCDVLVCVRGCEYPTLRVVQAAKAAGCFLVYFLDDDLLCIPDGNGSTAYYRDNKIRVYLKKILKQCDVLWAVNERILDKYGSLCRRQILSSVPVKLLRKPPIPGEKIHVLYAGSVDHSGLVREKLVPAIRRLLREYSDRVDFTFIGADPGLGHVAGVSCLPFFESYEKYQVTVLGGDFSIGLAPAYDTPFYACKYYNKFIEYSSCGIAGVYGACAPYTQIVQDGENGILCGPEPENWYLALRRLLEEPKDAVRYAENAASLLERRFTHATVAERLKEDLPELTKFQKEERIREIPLPSMRLLFYSERIRLLCRIYGLLAGFVIVFKAVKKLVKIICKERRSE